MFRDIFTVWEIFYYPNAGNTVKPEQITTESTALKLREAGNQTLVETLASEQGPLQSGALPEVDAATEGGKKALLDAITNQGLPLPKPQRTPCARGGWKGRTKDYFGVRVSFTAVCFPII